MLKRLSSVISCPKCSSNLTLTDRGLTCTKRGHIFPFHEGIPLLALHGSAETWASVSPAQTSRDYQLEYEDLNAARAYNEAYRNKATKRWSTAIEYKLLNRLLSGQERCETLLNIPSGGGRLSEIVAAYTDTLIEADITLGQLLYARQQGGTPRNRLWLTASAFHIPFLDNSIDGVVCCRLCHHLPTPVERERLAQNCCGWHVVSSS